MRHYRAESLAIAGGSAGFFYVSWVCYKAAILDGRQDIIVGYLVFAAVFFLLAAILLYSAVRTWLTYR